MLRANAARASGALRIGRRRHDHAIGLEPFEESEGVGIAVVG